MKYFTFCFLFLVHLSLRAQVTQGLVTWISFDKPDCEISDEFGDPAIQVFTNGHSCGCGVKGEAMRLNGNDEWFFLFGDKLENAFTTIDFSLSFYFKPVLTTAATQTLFSKRLECETDNAFFITFNPTARLLHVELSENNTATGSLTKTLPLSCWYHVVVVRRGATTILYINNEEIGRVNAPANNRVNITNNEPLTVGSSDCTSEADFNGLMDEIRIYSRALTREDVEDLYLAPDRIATGIQSSGTNDTTIFLGQSLQANLTNTCAIDFEWAPTDGVNMPDIPNPIITPAQTMTYSLEFTDEFGCSVTDSLRITVFDPSTLDCNEILLPTAFTPNNDGLNDTYGISNPFLDNEISNFQIFDRWGNIVFETTNPLDRWDGSYKGEPVNPGVFLYRISYRCDGQEGNISGSVTVIR